MLLLFYLSFKRLFPYFLVIFINLIALYPAPASNLQFFHQIQRNEKFQEELKIIVRMAIQINFIDALNLPQNLSPLFKERFPVFITAKKGDETRGCIGSLQPQTNSLAEEIQRNLKLAFTKDPRHKPIEKSEMKDLEIYLTFIGKKSSVQNIHLLSPFRDGVLIRSANKEAVVLPGEAKTQTYLLAFLKAKAGIKKGEAYQLYRLETLTMKAYP